MTSTELQEAPAPHRGLMSWIAEIQAEMREMPAKIRSMLLADLREALAAEMRAIQSAPPRPQEARESYSVEEVAALLNRSAYTVREWCREGRINATKRQERRGGAELWNISASEVARIQDEGLLQSDPLRNARR